MAAVGGAAPSSAPEGRLATRLRAVGRAARRRTLAGDQRAGSWARSQARTKQYAHLRRNWGWMLTLATTVAAVLAVTAALTPDPFTRGLVVGAGVTATAAILWQWTVQATGTAPVMVGDLGEQWTARSCARCGTAAGCWSTTSR